MHAPDSIHMPMARVSAAKRQQATAFFMSGRSLAFVMARVGLSKTTAWRISRQISRAHPRSRPGRPQRLKPADVAFLSHLQTTGKCSSVREFQAELRRSSGVEAAYSTVYRGLQRIGARARTRPLKPLLTEAHKRKRVAFAKKYKNWSTTQWRRVIFSDETKVTRIGAGGARICWRRSNEPRKPHHFRQTLKFGGGSVMVWACITAQGPGYLCRIDGKMAADGYKSILRERFLDTLAYYGLKRSDVVLQQDNDPKHVSKIVREWLHDSGIRTLDWPSQSPDLNPIENIWSIFKNRVAKLTSPESTLDDLWDKIQDAWNEITQEQCRKAIDSMPRRIQAVLDAAGGHTKW